MANSTEKINQIISSLDNKIIELEKRETINVTMRIDEVVPYLKSVLAIAEDDISTRKFDLTQNVTGTATITYTVNGEPASAGANVLKNGDTLVITVAAGTGYEIKSIKVNNKNYTSGTAITVTTDVNVVVVAELQQFALATQSTGSATITCTVGGDEVDAGAKALNYGDTLVITATAGEGYEISSLTVNGETFVSGSSMTVTGNVSVVAVAQLLKFNLTTQATNATISCTVGGDTVTDGTGVLTYGDTLVVSASADEGYEMDSLTVNGETFCSYFRS